VTVPGKSATFIPYIFGRLQEWYGQDYSKSQDRQSNGAGKTTAASGTVLDCYLERLRSGVPTAVMEGAVMPAYAQLSENQWTALATFLLNLRGVCALGSRSRDC
jgi:hypothetical protein